MGRHRCSLDGSPPESTIFRLTTKDGLLYEAGDQLGIGKITRIRGDDLTKEARRLSGGEHLCDVISTEVAVCRQAPGRNRVLQEREET